jgi:hypothetical protein
MPFGKSGLIDLLYFPDFCFVRFISNKGSKKRYVSLKPAKQHGFPDPTHSNLPLLQQTVLVTATNLLSPATFTAYRFGCCN